jgi:hypothetical protein
VRAGHMQAQGPRPAEVGRSIAHSIHGGIGSSR